MSDIDPQEIWERVQRIAEETGVLAEQVLLEIAEELPEPRRTELLKAIVERCQ